MGLLTAWFCWILAGFWFMDELYLKSIELERHPNSLVQKLAKINSNFFENHPQLQALSSWKNHIRSPVESFYEREMRLGNHSMLPEEHTTVQSNENDNHTKISNTEIESIPSKSTVPSSAPSSPKHILLLGGSSMKTAFGSILEQNLQERNLQTIREAQIGTGLSRADVIDWSKRLSELLERYPSIDLVIVQFIGNDCQAIVDSNHHVIAKYGTPEWNTAYIDKWDALLKTTQQANAELLIIGLPIMQNKRFDRRIQNVSSMVFKWAAEHKVDFIPIRDYTVNPSGQYTQYLEMNGRNRKIRLKDGVHLSFVGSTIVATEVFNTLNEKYHWPLISTDTTTQP